MGEVQAPEKELPLAAQIMDKVRKRFRNPMELVVALEKEGIINRGSGQRYDPSSVSSWARGASAVPGEVLLIAARLAEISIDEVLYGEAGETNKEDRKRIDKVERGLDELRDDMLKELEGLRKDLRRLGRIGRGHVAAELDEEQTSR